MSFGRGPLTNPFIAIGDFLLGIIFFKKVPYLNSLFFQKKCLITLKNNLVDPPAGDPLMGPIFGKFLN